MVCSGGAKKHGKNCKGTISVNWISKTSKRSRAFSRRKELLREQDSMTGKIKAHSFHVIFPTELQNDLELFKDPCITRLQRTYDQNGSQNTEMTQNHFSGHLLTTVVLRGLLKRSNDR